MPTRSRTAFIKARRHSELLKELERLQQDKSTRKGGGKGTKRLLPKADRLQQLKRKRNERVPGQLCVDEILGPATEPWNYVWQKESTLLCHLQEDDGTPKPGINQMVIVTNHTKADLNAIVVQVLGLHSS